MKQFFALLILGALLIPVVQPSLAIAEEPARAAPQAPKAPSSPSTKVEPPKAPAIAPVAAPTPAAAASNPTVSPSPSGDPGRNVVVQYACSPPKDGGGWTAKDLAPLLTGLAGLAGAFVAAIAIIFNSRTSRATNVQKANEAELESLQEKLDSFYGPYQQLSNTNQLIATDLKARHAAGAEMRILLLLVDPKWEDQFTPGEVTLVKEILSIDEKLLGLIQDRSGLVSEQVQPYLWRAASHFRIMLLAAGHKLDDDRDRYAHYVYPRQLDEIIELEIKRIRDRIALIRAEPLVLHPPAQELTIPERLALPDWPGRRVGAEETT
ncbi:hypothetical protein ACVWZM_006038 [Bradyrhizobium sp. USDA 4501]